MKLLKYETFLKSCISYNQKTKSNEDIQFIYDKYEIRNYTINEDSSIDVDGNVSIRNMDLTKLPLKFKNVTGNFDCSHNILTTLEGAPISVGGNFYCQFNQLVSLEGAPQKVGGYFDCSSNRLKTLEGGPKSVDGDFFCGYNQLTSLKGGPESVSGDQYYFHYNKVNDLTGFPEFWEGYVYFTDNPIEDILNKIPKDKVCKAIYWMNEFGVTHGGEINKERLDEVFITLGLNI